ncbi:MAG TPA: hypothetical protein VFZ61_30695 [Polyangiales bacterium]
MLDAAPEAGGDQDATLDAGAPEAGDAAPLDAGDAADGAGPADAAADGDAGDTGTDAAVNRVLINFEGLTAMPNGLVAVPAAARLSSGYLATTGAVFGSNGPFVGAR